MYDNGYLIGVIIRSVRKNSSCLIQTTVFNLFIQHKLLARWYTTNCKSGIIMYVQSVALVWHSSAASLLGVLKEKVQTQTPPYF